MAKVMGGIWPFSGSQKSHLCAFFLDLGSEMGGRNFCGVESG